MCLNIEKIHNPGFCFFFCLFFYNIFIWKLFCCVMYLLFVCVELCRMRQHCFAVSSRNVFVDFHFWVNSSFSLVFCRTKWIKEAFAQLVIRLDKAVCCMRLLKGFSIFSFSQMHSSGFICFPKSFFVHSFCAKMSVTPVLIYPFQELLSSVFANELFIYTCNLCIILVYAETMA